MGLVVPSTSPTPSSTLLTWISPNTATFTLAVFVSALRAILYKPYCALILLKFRMKVVGSLVFWVSGCFDSTTTSSASLVPDWAMTFSALRPRTGRPIRSVMEISMESESDEMYFLPLIAIEIGDGC